MKYTNFLLDLDHTLFDSNASEDAAFAGAMRAAGIDRPDRYRHSYQRINLALWAAVERHELTPQQVRDLRWERLVAEQALDADPAKMSADFVDGLGANGNLYDGVLETLQQLCGSASLALVTNGLSEVQRARLERLDIGQYFDAVVISAEVGVSKPAREIFDVAFAGLGKPQRESAVMVGDNLASDIQGGSNYGIATCWYNPHGASVPGTDAVVHEIRELSELLTLLAV